MRLFKKKKELEHICKNCRLFDSKNKLCSVVVLCEGERFNLPVEPHDTCFFENEFVAVKEELVNEQIVKTTDKFTLAEDIKEVKFWVEDPKTGKKTNKDGIVKIEYPEGFFGKENGIQESN